MSIKYIISILTAVLIINTAVAQNFDSLKKLFSLPNTQAWKLKDSILAEIPPDSLSSEKYEASIDSLLGKINSQNVSVITSLISDINNKVYEIKFTTYKDKNIYNQVLLNHLWELIVDSNKVVRENIRSFFFISTAYLDQLFLYNKKSKIQLRQILTKYPEEFDYSTFVQENGFTGLLPLIKDKLIINYKPSDIFGRNRKWSAMILCYKAGYKSILPFLRKFVLEEPSAVERFQKYEYVFESFKGEDLSEIMLDAITDKDAASNAPSLDQFVVPNSLFTTVYRFIPLYFKAFSTSEIENMCEAQNTNAPYSQPYYDQMKSCLYEATVNWFKSKGLWQERKN